MKGGNSKTHSNTKQLVIKTTIDNFSKFKIFLKKMSNIKNVDKESIKYLKKIDKKELKEYLNEIPKSVYEKTMKIIQKKKYARGVNS
jgi:intein/homing endonuclease